MNNDLASTASDYHSKKEGTISAAQKSRPVSEGKPALPQSAKIYSQKIAEIEKGVEEINNKRKNSEEAENFEMDKVDLGLCMKPRIE